MKIVDMQKDDWMNFFRDFSEAYDCNMIEDYSFEENGYEVTGIALLDTYQDSSTLLLYLGFELRDKNIAMSEMTDKLHIRRKQIGNLNYLVVGI